MATKSKTAPTSLASLLREKNFQPHQYVGARIPLQNINVLPQPRQTFEEIEALAEDIALKHLLNPLIVAQFDETSCQKYLSLINRLWGTSYSPDNLVSTNQDQKKTFYILLAGERRLRACLYLRDKGCEQCQQEFGQDGSCYQRHFGDESMEVRLCINIPPLEAIFIQASENIHMRVPPYEEATFYDQLFRLIRQMDPNYPLARFARQVGRSPSTIREAVKFCLLPDSIREFVENGLAYGIGCEIARLQEKAGLSERALEWWALTAITDNLSVKQVRDMVTEFLRTYNSGQMSLLGLLSAEEQQKLEKSHFRKVVERQAIQAIWMWIYYLRRVLALFKEGKLGQEDSPFSERSPVRVFRELLVQEELLLPHLRSFLPKRIRQQVAATIEEAERVLSELKKKASA